MHSSACWRAVTTRAHTEQPSWTSWFICATAGYCRWSFIHVSRRYAVIIGPGPHWFHELQWSWFEQRSQIHMITRCSAQFLVHFLSNGSDRGLRVITAAAVWLWCLLVCLLVMSWPPLCDESTAWRVDRVTSWPVTSWLAAICSVANSLPCPFAPWNESSRELSLPWTFVLWNLRSHNVYPTFY